MSALLKEVPRDDLQTWEAALLSNSRLLAENERTKSRIREQRERILEGIKRVKEREFTSYLDRYLPPLRIVSIEAVSTQHRVSFNVFRPEID